jgi:hypothetical protein
MWQVVFHPEASAELDMLPPRERVAILNVIEKLRIMGPVLPFPHQSAVEGMEKLRELRPRAGRSPWRAFYRQITDIFVIAAIGPEAKSNPRKFRQVTKEAVIRLRQIEIEDRHYEAL